MSQQQSLTIDAWIREAKEAANMVEDVESRIRVKDPEQEHRLIDIAKSKLLEVGVKIDRLESLLRNPPSKPILTGGDLEFRWKMLSDLRLRTRALVFSLCTPSSSKREGDLPAANTRETEVTIGSKDQERPKALVPKDDADLEQPLINDRPSRSFILMTLVRKICWTICLILGAAAIVVVLVILCAII
ncbi:hypothetical protein Tsubulata_000678 [Turnera subulata]|uniref:Uncharacterized protein n=1 Tax=Turnera subulata TaxID=218843 RepID=A0A9Q0FIR7_9ROSI|nr:hypothetical protein Tsubulata_000678 [Turnera subulata]